MKQKKVFYSSVCFIFFILMITGPGFLPAGEKPLPKAEIILDKFVEATGGLSAYDKIQNRVTKATMEIAGAGIKITMTNWEAKPQKTFSTAESAAIGKMEGGTDGIVVWENSAMTGPQIFAGKHRASMLHLSIFDKYAYWRKAFNTVECVGMENVDDKPCYKIIATPKDTHPETLFFDKESNLLVKVKVTMEHPMGTMPMESYLEDYKTVDGILVPFRTKLKIMGQDRVVTLTGIEHNVKMPEDRFKFPKEIQDLLDKKKEKKEKK